jgi:lysosomal alpha-mannosidase
VTKITEAFAVKSKSLNILFDKTGALNAIQLKDGKVVDFKQNFEYYKAKNDNDSFHQPSGAYVFRSDGDTPTLYNNTGLMADLVETSDVKEVRQSIGDYISQVIRITPNSDVIEFDFVVGPIPVDDKIGKEIISRWETNLTTNGLFYTDANGRQLLERKRDFRPTWKLTVNEEIAGNYYPVNSRIAIKDVKQDIQMTVLNDRSQGGSSIKDGSVELMVHRRDLYDDHFGVGEPLNEPGFDGKGLQIRGKFWIHFTSIAEAAEAHRETAFDILMEPSLTFAKYSGSEEEYLKSHKTQYSGLTKELPKNVHLLTLEQWKGSSYLLRLEHFYQQNESQTLSKPVTLDLKDLFTPFVVTAAVETTLSATQDKKTAKRLQFKSNAETNRFEPKRVEFSADDLSVTLNPMEIRTFIITVQNR